MPRGITIQDDILFLHYFPPHEKIIKIVVGDINYIEISKKFDNYHVFFSTKSRDIFLESAGKSISLPIQHWVEKNNVKVKN